MNIYTLFTPSSPKSGSPRAGPRKSGTWLPSLGRERRNGGVACEGLVPRVGTAYASIRMCCGAATGGAQDQIASNALNPDGNVQREETVSA